MELLEVQWPLVVFTFFMCLAGGIFAMQGYLTLRGKGKDIQFASLVCTLVTFAIGGIGVFLHLQHWERMFNGFGHITSPITHELIGVVIFAIVLVLYYLFMRRSNEGVPPQWCAIAAIIVGLVLPVLCGLSYMMAADPVWNTILLLLFYLADTVLLGSLTVFIIAKVKHCDEILKDTALIIVIGAVARLAIILFYAVAISLMNGDYPEVPYYFDPALPDSAKLDTSTYSNALLIGDLALVFWLLIIVVGSVLPAVVGVVLNRSGLKDKSREQLIVIGALACTVLGGVLWRCVLYWICIKVFPYFVSI